MLATIPLQRLLHPSGKFSSMAVAVPVDGAVVTPERLASDAAALVQGLEPDLVTPARAAELYRLFGQLARTASAGQTLLAARAAKSDRWKKEGHRSAASWMARTSGTGVGEAATMLQTAERLESLPGTTEALRHGALSQSQVREIAAAAASRPTAEGELLRAAGAGTFKHLKDRCRAVQARAMSATDENARYERVRTGRFFRHWSDTDGGFRGEFRITPDAGARLLAAVENRANALFEEARTAKRPEPTAAYRADALVELVSGAQGSASGARSVVHARIDAASLARGHTGDDEICEIAGVGPVPVATVRALLPEAFVKILITKGVDVLSVCHYGRSLTAHQRSAIEERDPVCVVPGCDVAHGLEIDHFGVDYADDGPTALHNLARLCHFHHFQKTYRGFRLSGGPGRWEWQPPPALDSS